ncbi:callose synthase 9-like [Nymphaea colorata]|nr:callose synthase 9-like [Nymphaea colorata]
MTGVTDIVCEHAYSLARNLDPDSEGRGVLQFKTGLLSVVKEFYKLYREKHKIDELQEEELRLRESGAFSGNLGESLKRKRVLATLKVLGAVVEQLSKEVSPEDADKLIPEELKRVMKSDAAMSEDLVAYNIVPLDSPSSTNMIVSFPEVKAAISALRYHSGLPKFPNTFSVRATRTADILDLLQHVFGFQKDNVGNQREHVILLLAYAQSRLGILGEIEPKLDEAAVDKVFTKSLQNYMSWCNYLGIHPAWNNLDLSKEKKITLISLCFLIWGQAANIKFLPEWLCYIFHHVWAVLKPCFLAFLEVPFEDKLLDIVVFDVLPPSDGNSGTRVCLAKIQKRKILCVVGSLSCLAGAGP